MKNKLRVKICGVRSQEVAEAVAAAGADYIGFILYAKSRRYIEPQRLKTIARALPSIKKVGVFVDEEPDVMNRIADECGLDYVQLHGNEPPAIAEQVERPVIKAYRYGDNFSTAAANSFPTEIILVDSYQAGRAGGTGEIFDWQAAKREIAAVEKPVLVAGGLNSDNAREACRIFSPYGIDISGGLEVGGEKSIDKIKKFMDIVRKIP